MKKNVLLSLVLAIFIIGSALAQDNSKSYFTSGTEFIFSWASIDMNDQDVSSVMRFTGWFHLQGMYNYDFGKSAGFFAGLALRNVGLIYDHPTEEGVRMKHRTYNLGIPVGLKVGKMNGMHAYAGYEIEFPYNYKEKKFVNEVKEEKFNVWFSDRVPVLYHTVLVGVQFKYGLNLKFKYYLTNFFNQNFSEVNQETGVTEYPYQNTEAQIFYVSLCFNLFRNTEMVVTH